MRFSADAILDGNFGVHEGMTLSAESYNLLIDDVRNSDRFNARFADSEISNFVNVFREMPHEPRLNLWLVIAVKNIKNAVNIHPLISSEIQETMSLLYKPQISSHDLS
jgi:hypothetical protein